MWPYGVLLVSVKLSQFRHFVCWLGRPRAGLEPSKLSEGGAGSALRLPISRQRSYPVTKRQSPHKSSLGLPASTRTSEHLVSALRERLAEEAQQDEQDLSPEQILTPGLKSHRAEFRHSPLQQTARRPTFQQQQQQRHLQVDLENLSQDPLQGIDSKTADAHDLLTRYSDLAKIGYLDSALKVVTAAVEADRNDVLSRYACLAPLEIGIRN